MELRARQYRTGERIRLDIRGGRIVGLEDEPDSAIAADAEDWVAPAFWDIQLNGRWGHSFSSPELTVPQVTEIVRAQASLGTARLCPTLITAPVDEMLHGLRTIAAACDSDPVVARMILGIHLEGPFLSEREGFRGAHPASAIRDPDWGLLERFQAASGGRIVLITLAPERPGAIEFIGRAALAGIVVALGHTAADGPTIHAAVQAGARLSTHLGNGIAMDLPRHPNPIWHQAAQDQLSASLIADGHHLDPDTLRVLARVKGPGKIILVSDASPLAGLAAGLYGPWEVDPSGKIVVAGTPYLAGSNQSLETGIVNLMAATAWTLGDVLDTVTRNPADLLGRGRPEVAVGQAADLVVFRHDRPDEFILRGTWADGDWHEPAG
jgi:N-acetylglucosamine-6-phosphate deacetylase